MYHILIVEDEYKIARFVSLELEHEGYKTTIVSDGREALAKALEEDFDLIVLDVMLPSLNGIEILRRLRQTKDTPVIILTARDQIVDKVAGLDIGADDYVTKPFPMNELLARIKANIRRSSNDMIKAPVPDASAVIHIRGLEIDTTKCQVVRDGQTIELTKKEYELLTFMAKNEGTIYSREQLLGEVWGYDGFYGDTSSVDVTVSRLRSKLEKDAGKPEYLFTKRGMGYYIK